MSKTTPQTAASSPVKHCVLMKFKSNASDEKKNDIFKKLDLLRLKDDLDTLQMVHGPFAPSQSGPDLSRSYTDGLVVTFGSVEDRNRYNIDSDHQAILQSDILPNLQGGINGLLRFDFEEADPATDAY